MASEHRRRAGKGARLAPQAGLNPEVALGDGRWETVLRVLRARNTVTLDILADTIDRQVQEQRQRHVASDG